MRVCEGEVRTTARAGPTYGLWGAPAICLAAPPPPRHSCTQQPCWRPSHAHRRRGRRWRARCRQARRSKVTPDAQLVLAPVGTCLRRRRLLLVLAQHEGKAATRSQGRLAGINGSRAVSCVRWTTATSGALTRGRAGFPATPTTASASASQPVRRIAVAGAGLACVSWAVKIRLPPNRPSGLDFWSGRRLCVT